MEKQKLDERVKIEEQKLKTEAENKKKAEEDKKYKEAEAKLHKEEEERTTRVAMLKKKEIIERQKLQLAKKLEAADIKKKQ